MCPAINRFREVGLPDGVSGRLFLHSMPGRNEPLEETWAEVGRRKVSTIVSLASLDEVREKSPDFAKALEAGSLPCDVCRFPVCDFQGPDDDEGFWRLATEIATALRQGQNILVHCGAGIGRTGMFAIASLMALGLGLDGARSQVKAAGSEPERQAQDQALRRLESRSET